MKITWKGTLTGQVGFHAELQEYDAVPPVDSLLIDHAPASMNPEREAVAAYLAFGHWTSGDLQLPHRVGPNTAAAIEQDMQHIAIRPGPIEYYPKPLEIGSRKVHLGFDANSVKDAMPAIAVLQSTSWVGALRAMQSVAVASNAFTLDRAVSSTHECIRSRLAVGVLFAADLSADTLIVSGSNIPELEKARLANLLLSVRLGVHFE